VPPFCAEGQSQAALVHRFQVLSTRKRKDATEEEIKVQVCLFAFDLLYLNGRSYVRETFKTRRDTLRAHFRHQDGKGSLLVVLRGGWEKKTEPISPPLRAVSGDCDGCRPVSFCKLVNYVRPG
jgi:DNA ligase-1